MGSGKKIGERDSAMARKSLNPQKSSNSHKSSNPHKANDMWIAPKPSAVNGAATRKWSEPPAPPASSRLLDLADIALGTKKPENYRKRRSGILKPKP
jgi:hypothetical protein